MIAIAFDPGVTTGYAIGELDGKSMVVSTEQDRMTVKQLYDRLEVLRPDFIIWEKFQYRNQARAGLILYSKELIGILEFYVQNHPQEVKKYEQSPGSVINGYFNPDKLKSEGLWKPGMLHANEALMHLLYWFTFASGYQYNKKGYRLADGS